MSFFRHEEIYRPMDVRIVPGRPAQDRPRPHRYDEFPAGYSSAGCAPAEPASASPAEAHLAGIGPGSTIDLQRTANRLLTPCLTQGDKPNSYRKIPMGSKIRTLHKKREECGTQELRVS